MLNTYLLPPPSYVAKELSHIYDRFAGYLILEMSPKAYTSLTDEHYYKTRYVLRGPTR